MNQIQNMDGQYGRENITSSIMPTYATLKMSAYKEISPQTRRQCEIKIKVTISLIFGLHCKAVT